MDSLNQTSDAVPLIILDPKRAVTAVGLINEKAYKKSIEQNQLWKVDENTFRVLPAGAGMLVSLDRFDGWVEAICGEGRESDAAGSPTTPDNTQQNRPTDDSTFADESVLRRLTEVIRQRRKERPQGSYTTYLFDEGSEKIRKKTGEEAIELILADDRDRIVSEAADLVYHLLVLLEVEDIKLDELLSVLGQRRSE